MAIRILYHGHSNLEIHSENPYRWHEIAKDWRGVSEETTTGVRRLYKMAQENRLLVQTHVEF